jgi:putative hydrolase of HD superfamily
MLLNGPYFGAPTLADAESLITSFPKDDVHVPRKLIIARQDDDTLIGLVSWYWESEESRWPGIGIVLYDDSQWRRGFGYEALGLWCQMLFDRLDIHRMDLRTWSGNEPMQGLSLKLGFKEEARFREARQVGGRLYDSLAFGMLRTEWKALHPFGFGKTVRES